MTDNKLDCRFCHVYASKSASAGIPPVAKCMMCHRVIATAAKERWEVVAYLRTLK